MQWTQCTSSLRQVPAATPSHGTCCFAQMARSVAQRCNVGNATVKCAKRVKTIAHQSSRTSTKTAYGFGQSNPLKNFASVFTINQPQADNPLFEPAKHLGRQMAHSAECFFSGTLKNPHKRQSCHKLVTGKWNITPITPGAYIRWVNGHSLISTLFESLLDIRVKWSRKLLTNHNFLFANLHLEKPTRLTQTCRRGSTKKSRVGRGGQRCRKTFADRVMSLFLELPDCI